MSVKGTTRGIGVLLLLATLTACSAAAVRATEWNPATFAKVETLKLRTNCVPEGEYWFPVWLVVIDDQVYVRLGSKAVSRIECNSTAPFVGVEIAGERFDHVRGVPAPETAEQVNKAMADKYTSDLFIRWFSHPLTLRLMPE